MSVARLNLVLAWSVFHDEAVSDGVPLVFWVEPSLLRVQNWLCCHAGIGYVSPSSYLHSSISAFLTACPFSFDPIDRRRCGETPRYRGEPAGASRSERLQEITQGAIQGPGALQACREDQKRSKHGVEPLRAVPAPVLGGEYQLGVRCRVLGEEPTSGAARTPADFNTFD